GEWDDALSEFGAMRELLDERRDEPPYFAAHAFATTAMIHHARGDRVESDRLTDTLTGLSQVSGRLYPFLLRLFLRRGEIVRANALERPSAWAVHRGDAYEGESERIAAVGAWEGAPASAAEMRDAAANAGTTLVPAFADRLEGRAAFAGGDAARAASLLGTAVDRFADHGAIWERALTQVDLARVLAVTGDRAGADEALRSAAGTFET